MKVSERRKLEVMFNMIDTLIDQTYDGMPLRQALALLSVAIHEAKEGDADLMQVGKDTGSSSAVVSRDLLALGKRGRTKKPGLELIRAREDYTDLRRKPYILTAKGKRTVGKLLETL